MAKVIRRCKVQPNNNSGDAPIKASPESAVELQAVEIEPELVKEKKISYRMATSKEYDKKKESKIFAQADSALAFVNRQFINAAWKYTFLNRDKNAEAHFITTPMQFNQGVRKMKNYFCDQMIRYLHAEDKYPRRADLNTAELFDQNGAIINPETNIPYYIELMHEFESKFFDTFDIQAHPAKNVEKFNAFSAFYIMNNFDAIIEELLEGIIKIENSKRGRVNNTSYAKNIARLSSVYWAGEDHESKNIEKFTSHMAKLIISTIPKVTEVTSARDRVNGIHRYKLIGDLYLTPSDLYMIAGILKKAESDYNIIHLEEIKNGTVQPIIFNDDPKGALKRLLTDNTIPVMQQFGYDLTTSLRAFLYDDTETEYAVEKLFGQGITLNSKTLDIEQLLAFEINKNVTPTYAEFGDDGTISLKNYGRRYKASNQLEDNLRNYVFLESFNPKPAITAESFKSIKGKTLNQIEADPTNLFNLVCKELFNIDDTSLPQYQDFLSKHFDTIMSICESLCDIHDSRVGVKKTEDIYERAESVDEFVRNRVESKIKAKYQQLKWDVNKFLSILPMTNFDNLGGSSIPVYRLSSALFQYVLFLHNFHSQDPNRRKLNMFVESPNILSSYNERPKSGQLVNTNDENINYETPAGFLLDAGTANENSEIDKMHPNDQLFVSFMGNWNALRKKGMFACQIAPYSDKSSIGVVFANLLALIYDPTDNRIGSKIKTLESIISSDNALNEISRIDYYYRKNSKLKLVNNILKAWNLISQLVTIKDKNGVEIHLPVACEYLSDTELALEYDNTKSMSNKLLTELDKLDNWLLQNGKDINWDDASLIASKNNIELIDNVFYASILKNGEKYCFNQSLKWMINNLKSLDSFRAYETKLGLRFLESSEVKFLTDRLLSRELADQLLESKKKTVNADKRSANAKLWATIIEKKLVDNKDKKGKHYEYAIKDLAKLNLMLLIYQYANNLLRSQYMDLISKDAFADKGFGQFIYGDLTSNEILLKLAEIETKRFSGEKLTKAEEDFANEVLFTYGETEYSARVAGMAKRMVLYPATIENFSLNTLRGISPIIHVAVVDDVAEEVWNLKGETHGQEIFDGSGWVSVYYSYMENASMPGNEVKGTKKTLGVNVSDNNSSLFKWAEFELNNDRIRRSTGNKFKLIELFKKMHDKYKFGDEVDLTKSMFPSERKLLNPSSLVGRRIFYRDGFNDYEILKFSKTGKSQYTITVQGVSESGERYGKEFLITREIHSIYDLWQLFGSYNSMELGSEGKLIYSDINNEAIYLYITRVGEITDSSKSLTLNNVKQPLRNLFVSIVATKAAVKRGSANINSHESVWKNPDRELATFDISTKNFGIQLDANHHADLAQLTEMTQTISALAANGHTSHYADEAYQAIADIIEGSLGKVRSYLSDIEAGNIESTLLKLSKEIVEALATEKNLTTALSLIKAIETKLLGSQLILPISDKRFYKIFAKNIFSDLNKSSIKRKYTGLGGILNPSGNILQLYQLDGKAYLFEDLVKRARKAFSKNEKRQINDYFILNPQIDKNEALVKLFIIRSVNPETSIFTEDDSLTLLEIDNALSNDVYGKMPGYGLKLVLPYEVNVLDSVAYYNESSDRTEAPTPIELSTIASYTDLQWVIKPTELYLNCTKPRDLRPQIEHWTAEEVYTQGTVHKNTWSEPAMFMTYNVEHMLDSKKKRWQKPEVVAAVKKSTWCQMLKGLIYNQKVPMIALVHPELNSLEISQLAMQQVELDIDELFSLDDATRILKKREIKKLLDNLRMRSSELRAYGFDFGNLVQLENGMGFDFNRYFCGHQIDLSKSIKENDPILKEVDFAIVKDFHVDPAEAIMPKLYKTNYQLGDTNLADIDLDFFRKAQSYYESSLIKVNDDKSRAPIDFLIRTHVGNFNVVFLSLLSKISSVYGTDITKDCRFEQGWRLDDDGNRIYKVPKKGDFAIYSDADGNETLIIRKTADAKKSMDVLIRSLDSKESSTPFVSVQPFLENLYTAYLITESLIDMCIKYNHIKTHNQMLKTDKSLKGERLVSALKGIYKMESEYKKDLANTLYNSFVKTLDVISTRIPTQALLSFMAMHVAALTNDESNNVFVSRWLLWLQGSDLDIDKSYMMGVDVNNIGTYHHWSPLADFTTEELTKISDSLPLPSKHQIATKSTYWKYNSPILIEENPDYAVDDLMRDYILTEDANNDTELADLRVKYDLKTNRKLKESIQLTIKSKLLQIINNRDGKISMSPDLHNNLIVSDVIEDLNLHNAHKLTANESRNCVAKAIQKVSLDGRNMLSGYSPIDRAMALFTEELENHTFSLQLRNIDDTVSIFRIQYENAVGKQDVGIMANGLKAFFAMTQYFNHYWNSEEFRNSDRGRFIRSLKIGELGKAKTTVRETIADTQIGDVAIRALNEELRSIDPEAAALAQKITTSNDDASLLISSLVSLATDNAKELALAKLNAGINLACIHVFLTVMGYSAADIVSYTTSDLFKDFTELITPSQFDKNATGKIDKYTWAALFSRANDHAGDPTKYLISDVVQLLRIYDSAQEMTTLSKMLGINLGVKVDEFIAASFAHKFEDILYDQVDTILEHTAMKNKQITTKNGRLDPNTLIPILLSNLGLPTSTALVTRYSDKIADLNSRMDRLNYEFGEAVDMNRYFNDEEYREFIVDLYDLFKENFNIYDILNHSKHFYLMLNAFNDYMLLFINTNSRAQWTLVQAYEQFNPYLVINEEEDEYGHKRTLFKVPYNFTDKEGRKVNRLYDDYILSEFLQEESDYDFKITFPTIGRRSYNINYGKNQKTRNPNIRKFIEFVNIYLIPELRRLNPSNKFIQSIIPDLDAVTYRKGERKSTQKSEIKWKFNFDIDSLTSPDSVSKYNDVVGGFDELVRINDNGAIRFLTLQDVFPDANFEFGENVRVGDLLYLYDQISNFGTFGQATLDKAFERYILYAPEIPLKIAQIELEHDKGLRKMEIDPHILMAQIVKNAVAFNTLTGGKVIFKDGVAPIDVKNTILLCADSIKYTDNDYYKKCAKLLDAIRFNLIEILTVC